MKFIFLLLLALSCSTAAEREGRIIMDEVEYSRKGTRSEAEHGMLYIGGSRLPDCFTLVHHKGRTWNFHQRTGLWGRDGYFPVEGSGVRDIITATADPLDCESLAKGWREGTALHQNTPENWIFVRWPDGSAFVDPLRINDMVKALGIKPIPRVVTSADKKIRFDE